MAQQQRGDRTLRYCFAKIGQTFSCGKSHSYSFEETDGILHRHFHFATGRTVKKVVIPKKLREPILLEAHEGTRASYHGLRRRAYRVLEGFYWPHLYIDAKHLFRSCGICHRAPHGKLG